MSNAIANSFALLNEIRQELNQTKAANMRNISKSPSPKKLGLSSTTVPFTSNIPGRSISVHKTSKYPNKNSDRNNESALDRYVSDNFEETLQMKKKKTNGYDSVKNESLEKNSETQSSELIFKLKEKIDGEIINFSDSCDEITNKINDLIKNIDKNNNDLRDHRIIDEESDDESDEEEDEEITKSRKKGKHSKNKKDNKQKYSNFEEKNMFKNLNESFNKIVQNLDTKKFDNLSKKLNS